MRRAVFSTAILQRLAQYIEKADKLNSQVKAAMIYPVAVISIAVIVIVVILWKVIPVFAALFEGLGAEVPGPTVFVMKLSYFINDFWWLIGGVMVATWISLKRYHATYKGKRVLDGILLNAPILGMLLRKIAVARFCRTLSTLTASGVPILEGLDSGVNDPVAIEVESGPPRMAASGISSSTSSGSKRAAAESACRCRPPFSSATSANRCWRDCARASSNSS